MTSSKIYFAFVVLLCLDHFQNVQSFTTKSITNKNLFILNVKGLAKPKFNKSTNKWDKPAGYDEEETYGPVGSLLRQGPGPFITRLSNADEYEQAVLKYMASEGVSRLEAQGNMDAYFNNAADWAYQKMEEKKGAPKVDYNKIKTKDVALSAIWGLFITPLLLRIVLIIATTGNWDVSLSDVANFSQ